MIDIVFRQSHHTCCFTKVRRCRTHTHPLHAKVPAALPWSRAAWLLVLMGVLAPGLAGLRVLLSWNRLDPGHRRRPRRHAGPPAVLIPCCVLMCTLCRVTGGLWLQGWTKEQYLQYCRKDVFGAHADRV